MDVYRLLDHVGEDSAALAAHIVQIPRDVIGRRREIHDVNVLEESAICA